MQQEDDEEEDPLRNQNLTASQETAGFNEGEQRVALGGLFNLLFFFSTLGKGQQDGPSGAFLEQINKNFGDFDSFKNSFTKIVG